ncbi:hypothetical protein [Crocinitomix catalasitica]|uniref:hypothetical protein n=1 Tax=Crocinitomix catalasitica TaxID=184607 RepID=UPI00048681D8|nr:hypothetical protein [Crocinitomix catalasitica]
MLHHRIKLLLITSLLTVQLKAQSDTLSDAQLIYTYHEILRTDRSNVKNEEIRHLIFRRNFNTIISIIRTQGYPILLVEPKKRKDKYIIFEASSITFFHILQTFPDKLLDPEIINLLKTEIESGRMPNDLLKKELIVWKKMNDLPNNKYPQKISTETLTLYQNALKVLKMEE